jgi:hypothetical protein
VTQPAVVAVAVQGPQVKMQQMQMAVMVVMV